jgi:hypothetical protein
VCRINSLLNSLPAVKNSLRSRQNSLRRYRSPVRRLMDIKALYAILVLAREKFPARREFGRRGPSASVAKPFAIAPLFASTC